MRSRRRWVTALMFVAGLGAVGAGTVLVVASRQPVASSVVTAAPTSGSAASLPSARGSTTTVAPPASAPPVTPAPEVQATVDQWRAEADRYAALGKSEVAHQMRANADKLEQSALAGNPTGPTAAEIRALFGVGGTTVPRRQFAPEGQVPCEPGLVPTDIALGGWCWIYPDQQRGMADVIAVGSSRVMVVLLGGPRSAEVDAAMQKAFGMVLADPSRAAEAMALVATARKANPSGGFNPGRVVTTFDPAIDVASTAISTHRQGDGYVLQVGSRTIRIAPTWPANPPPGN